MKKIILLLCLFNISLMSKGISQTAVLGKDSLLVIQEGTASFYGKRFHKRKTASGEIFNMNDDTAAHKHLPFGTLLKVTNKNNGYEVIVNVNDRLPKNSTRIIDLSRAAAEQLDMIEDGLVPVKLQARSFDAIKKLKEYYKVIPSELRLRVYSEPVPLAPRKAVFFSDFHFQKGLKLAGIYTILNQNY
jgi:rare lipoprotein A